ncbi:sodium:proton antiporter [archaeon]|nr:sodium:proton antiporter [archaeon]
MPAPSLNSMMNILILIVAVSMLVRLIRLPYTIALVFAGLILSHFSSFTLPQISPEAFLTVLLPPLVFSSAAHLDSLQVKKEAKAIISFAFLGTLLSAFLIGLFSYFFFKFSLLESLLLGVIISPTDAVATVSVFKELGVSETLTTIVEGEALFNDGVAVVLYSSIISAFTYGTINLSEIAIGILLSILVGTLIGLLFGYLTNKIFLLTKDKFVQAILTIVATYGCYQVATQLGGSGIVSVAITGLAVGNFIHKTQTKEISEAFDLVWDFTSFIVTSVSFVLIGIYLDISTLFDYIWLILLSVLTTLAVRTVTVYGLSDILNFSKRKITRSWQNIIIWSGLRGIISIMLILGLPVLPIPHAEEITAIVFGTVFFSVLLQGMSIKTFVKKFYA